MNKSAFVVAALTGWLLVGAVVAAPQFVPGPSARYGQSMAYDSARDVVVLFGGNSSAQWSANLVGDTWEWDGVTWAQQNPPNAPSPRGLGSMCYDAVRGVCVFFGGLPLSNETWEWDGIAWTQRVLPTTPSARYHVNMVYDAARQVAVMFGGWTGSSAFGDTWEYDGTDWLSVSVTGPAARSGHSMAYDSVRSRTVMFGGWDGSTLYGDTWEWDGTSWLAMSSVNSPSPRDTQGMCFDAASGHVVLFGGNVSGAPLNDTWMWNGVDWVQANPVVQPQARAWSIGQIVYDAGAAECVLFGGLGAGVALDDTWAFYGAEWHPKLDYVVSPINGNRYALTPAMTWQAAENVAHLECGHLATVRSSQENAWIFQVFWPASLPIYDFYIGLNDNAQSNVWEWSSGEAVGYTNWSSGSPNGNSASAANFCCSNATWQVYAARSIPGLVEIPALSVSSATTYGTGCGTHVLGFFPTANPILGTTAGAVIANAPTSVTGVTMGWSDSHLASLPLLPLELTFIGMPGCSLLHSNDVFGLPVTPLTASTLQFDYSIPHQVSLLGAHVYLQAYCFAPGENSLQVIVSNGIDWLIGN